MVGEMYEGRGGGVGGGATNRDTCGLETHSAPLSGLGLCLNKLFSFLLPCPCCAQAHTAILERTIPCPTTILYRLIITAARLTPT